MKEFPESFDMVISWSYLPPPAQAQAQPAHAQAQAQAQECPPLLPNPPGLEPEEVVDTGMGFVLLVTPLVKAANPPVMLLANTWALFVTVDAKSAPDNLGILIGLELLPVLNLGAED